MSDTQRPEDVRLHLVPEEAERSAVGSLLLNPSVLPIINSITRDGADFHDERYRFIVEAMNRLVARAQEQGITPVLDITTITTELEQFVDPVTNRSHLEEIGGLAWLMTLMNETPSALHAEGYASLVAEDGERRELEEAARKNLRLALDRSKTIGQVRAESRGNLTDVIRSSGRVKTLADIREDALTAFWGAHLGPENPAFVSSGLETLDENTGYMFIEGRLIELPGAPAVGKSSIMRRLGVLMSQFGGPPVMHNDHLVIDEQTGQVIHHHAPGLIVSLEMYGGTWGKREGMQRANLSDQALRRMDDATARTAIEEAMSWTTVRPPSNPQQEPVDLPLYFMDHPKTTVSDIEALVAGMPQLRFLIVDSAHKLSEVLAAERKHVVLDQALARLQGMAREYGLVIWVTMERNRVGGYDSLTKLDKMRDAGEYPADTVIAVDDLFADKQGKERPEETFLLLSILKNRDGPKRQGTMLGFHEPTQVLREVTSEAEKAQVLADAGYST